MLCIVQFFYSQQQQQNPEIHLHRDSSLFFNHSKWMTVLRMAIQWEGVVLPPATLQSQKEGLPMSLHVFLVTRRTNAVTASDYSWKITEINTEEVLTEIEFLTPS